MINLNIISINHNNTLDHEEISIEKGHLPDSILFKINYELFYLFRFKKYDLSCTKLLNDLVDYVLALFLLTSKSYPFF